VTFYLKGTLMMRKYRLVILLLLAFPLLIGQSDPDLDTYQTYLSRVSNASPARAFPGAEGFGTTTVGGRGGEVYIVDTLADSGRGSLRECMTAEGPRICVFQVAGTINLLDAIRIENPYLTVAGQTAPGGGITLKTDPSNRKGLVTTDEEGHDVVVRYIRLRPGPSDEHADTLDGFTINTEHVVLDHVSISWAVDENINVWTDNIEEPTHDVTISWSIISEALSNSVHPWGEHSKGMLLGNDEAYNFSVHHNLFAHNSDRNPEIKGRTGGIIDIVNNVSYNYGWRNAIISDKYGIPYINYVGNYTKLGADSNTKEGEPITAYEVRFYEYTDSDKTGGDGVHLYLRDNIGPNRPDNSYPEDAVIDPEDSKLITYLPAPHPASYVTTLSAEDAYTAVLAEVGASKGIDCTGNWYLRRDAVDTRIVNDVKNGTGEIIDDPAEVGGWPEIDPGVPCTDNDKDGMADEWELLYFQTLDKVAADDHDGDGYTNIEEFFNGVTP
jgi:pectate lyase